MNYVFLNNKTNETFNVVDGFTSSDRLDETFDNASCISVASESEEPFDINTPITITISDDDGNVKNYYFVVVGDSVSIYSTQPLSYQHQLQLVDKSERLKDYLVRNSVFSQPANNKQIMRANRTYMYDISSTPPTQQTMGTRMNYIRISPNSKVSRLWIKLETLATKLLAGGTRTEVENILIGFDITLNICDALNNNEIVYSKTFSSNDDLGKEIILDSGFISNLSGTYFIQISTTSTISDEYNYFEIHASSGVEYYYYTLYDVIYELREQMLQDDATSLFKIGTEGTDIDNFEDLLKSTIAPNFVFTQASLWDALIDIFSYLGGYPYLTADNTLNIYYYNNLDNNEFTISNKRTSKKTSLGKDNYASNLITYFQKGIPENSVIYPAENHFLPITSRVFGVADKNSWVLKVNQPIEEIVSVKILVPRVRTGLYWKDNVVVDITDWVYEAQVWGLLNNAALTTGTLFSKNQINTVYFTKGSDEIYVGNINDKIDATTYSLWNAILSALDFQYGISAENTSFYAYIEGANQGEFPKLKYQVVYVPKFDGRAELITPKQLSKVDLLSNQGAGATSLERLGTSTYGTALKLGNKIKNDVLKFADLSNVIQKGQYYIDENGKIFFANSIQYTFHKDFIVACVDWTENYNKLSPFISVDSAKRYTNISSELTLMSEDSWVESVLFSSVYNSNIANEELTIGNINFINNLLATFSESNSFSNIDFATLTNANGSEVLFPLVKYNFGNQLCFEMQMKDSISAGNNMSIRTGWFGSNKYYNEVVSYTDDEGFLDDVEIHFYSSNDNDDFSGYPVVIPTSEVGTGLLLNGFNKRPNEVLGINYQISVVSAPNEQIFISNDFMRNMAFIKGFGGYYKSTDCKIVYSNTHLYSQLDTDGYDDGGYISAIGMHYDTTYNAWYLSSNQIEGGCVSFALVDANNKIILAVNKKIVATFIPTVYLSFIKKPNNSI